MSKECLGQDCIYWNYVEGCCNVGPDEIERFEYCCPFEQEELSNLTKDKVLELLRGYLLNNQKEEAEWYAGNGHDALSLDWLQGSQCALESAIMLVRLMED